MLINLSNHKLLSWNENQKSEGLKYGEIVDYAFPNIEPSWDESQISKLADEIILDIITKYGKKVVVHIMGEFTLSYALICRFRKFDIKCVASCTERNVLEMDNGEKIVRFNFVRFRDYE